MDQLIYLYPIPEYFDFDLKHRSKKFKEEYKGKLNRCIDLRYRKKGFQVNFALFDDHSISDMIRIYKKDRIIRVGLSFNEHTTQVNGEYPYPNQDFILDQLGDIDHLRVAGFHIWDCVEKLAERAHQRGIDVLVDEDLTNIFRARIQDEGFREDIYPSYDPGRDAELLGKNFKRYFLEARKNKPWLWQNY